MLSLRTTRMPSPRDNTISQPFYFVIFSSHHILLPIIFFSHNFTNKQLTTKSASFHIPNRNFCLGTYKSLIKSVRWT